MIVRLCVKFDTKRLPGEHDCLTDAAAWYQAAIEAGIITGTVTYTNGPGNTLRTRHKPKRPKSVAERPQPACSLFK